MRKRLVKKVLNHGRHHRAAWIVARGKETLRYARATRALMRRFAGQNRKRNGWCCFCPRPWSEHRGFLRSWKCARVVGAKAFLEASKHADS